MPARDLYHNNFRNALVKDGWTVTHDPFRLKWGGKDMYVDIGAERILAAEKSGKKIAVEIKSFTGASELNDIENAMGQYIVYRSVMARTEPDRSLYLAVHKEVFLDIFEEPLGRLLIEDYSVPVIVFDFKKEVILKWML
ncbi:MAG: fatty-acid synthase [Desulfobacterales bacterium]|nr:fatty-acid synthase [Desulfobacterales bacterium]